MKLRLDKKDFKPFLQNLINHYDLYAPVRLKEGVSVYKKIDQPGEVDLTLLNPQKPLKEVFFPQSEVMFHYVKTGKKYKITSTEEIERERVVLGARPCDIEAISIIDEVFSEKEHTDLYFLNKRKKTIIIGMACLQPLSTCFCSSTGGGPFVRKGSDLFLIDLGEAYLIEILTEKGKAFARNSFSKKPSDEEINLANELEEKASRKTDSSLSVQGIEKRLDLIMENPFWEQIHEKCVGCGVCTYLCPTCHCFDILDEALDEQGKRVRNWDSCLFPLYTQETSGHNPRPTGRERTRQRLMHKFNYFPKNFGRIACVGCGRCIVYCPVNFDIREEIKEIQRSERIKTVL
ncbi:MAG: 4Fe-4S dicluster domain-containing protein [Thermodesulfobacteriota bacterium]|nr:4Fe-4S dicluster domain-containing protein [Thermodesulfobacteriota bacterium]